LFSGIVLTISTFSSVFSEHPFIPMYNPISTLHQLINPELDKMTNQLLRLFNCTSEAMYRPTRPCIIPTSLFQDLDEIDMRF